MQFTELFIRKPVLSTVLSLFILLIGIKSFALLTIRLYPIISPSVININTIYPGAPAELVEGFVTTPLENALGGIEGIDIMRSSSKQGSSQITLQFKLGYDLTKAMANVSNAIASVRRQLGKDVLDPTINTQDPNAKPSIFIAFKSNTLAIPAITDYLNRVVQPQLQTLPGVSEAQVLGSSYAMRLWLNPIKMAAYKVTASDIINALEQNNIQTAPGSLRTPWEIINITANTDLHTADEFNHLVIRQQNNYLVRLSDIGQAVLDIKTKDTRTSINGNASVLISIVPLSTANPLDISNAVNKLLPQITAETPSNITVHLIYDASQFIKASLSDVKNTILEACLFVFFIIFLFLGNLRAALVPIITIPLSLLGVCAAMLVLGYSLNILTFLAWVLGIGLVVDDAIVVLENIHRHMSLGKTPENAAIIGTKQIGFAVIAMTLTLASVYAPIGFINDATGLLFREFAFTLAAAVIISGFIALTLSPIMCSRLLQHDTKTSPLSLKIDEFFSYITKVYKKCLGIVLLNRKAIIGLTLIIYMACLGLFKALPHELAPQEDQGIIMTIADGPTSANFSYMEKYMSKIDKVNQTTSGIDTTINLIGVATPTLNESLSYLILNPWDQRKVSSLDIVRSLYKRYMLIPGLQTSPINPESLPISSGHSPLMFVLKSTDSYASLNQLSQKLQRMVLQNNPKILNLQFDLKMNLNQVNLAIDRDKANSLGISMSNIANSLNTLIGEPQDIFFNLQGRLYQVIPQLYPNYMSAEQQLKLIYTRSQTEKLIPLANVIKINHSETVLNLNHFQQLRSVTFSSNLAPGYTVGQAVNYIIDLAHKILPNTVQIDFDGNTRDFIDSGNSMNQTFLFALMFIFLVLAAQFESFRAPFIILLTVPLSLAGALLAIYLTHGSLNIYTQIGLITLIGLITKHGILIVEFARQLQKNPNLSIQQAVIEAASIRLRPICMTTGAMLLAAIPLAFAHGPGAHARNQLGWVILGGMSIGTLFTLFILPVVYTLIYNSKPTSPDKINEAEDKTETVIATD